MLLWLSIGSEFVVRVKMKGSLEGGAWGMVLFCERGEQQRCYFGALC
jgi:hypothetical protein